MRLRFSFASALKVKIEQSYGILNRHKVCPNEFQVKKAILNLSTFSFCFCVLLPSDYILRSRRYVEALILGFRCSSRKKDDTPSQKFQHFLFAWKRKISRVMHAVKHATQTKILPQHFTRKYVSTIDLRITC
jgi:hypothetical protein